MRPCRAVLKVLAFGRIGSIMKTLGSLLLVASLLFPLMAHGGQQMVPPEEMASHVAKWVKPAYPPLARATRLRGEVIIQVKVSKSGSVGNLKVKSGHPLLVEAATEAVRQWKFSPFLSGGQPVSVEGLIKVQFPPGDSAAAINESQEQLDQFYIAMDACRDLVQENQAVDAEHACEDAILLAGKLDSRHQLERMDAFQQTGHALLLQRKFTEALDYYRKELRAAGQAVGPLDAELAAAHHHVGNALWAVGRSDEARAEYEIAESIFQQGGQQIDSEFLRNEYARNLKSVMQDHAKLLRQMDLPDEAAELERLAASIEVKSGKRE